MEKKKSTRAIGKDIEDLAREYLEKQGLKFLEANYTCKLGEIDLIMEDGLTLLPIEIKLSKTFSKSYFQNMERWFSLKGNNNNRGYIIYTGNTIIGKNNRISVYPWNAF